MHIVWCWPVTSFMDLKHSMNVNLVNLKDDSEKTGLKDIQEKDAEISLVRSWVESGEKT